MNTFEILKGFQSDDVQDFVKQKETQAKPQPKVQPKAKVAPKPTQSAPQKGGKRNRKYLIE